MASIVQRTSKLSGQLSARSVERAITKRVELLHRAPIHPDSEWLDFLQTLAAQGAIAMENGELFEKLQRMNQQLTVSYDETIMGWSRALDLRDREPSDHSERVIQQTVRLARLMGIPDDEIEHIRRGALLHDIGKWRFPTQSCTKPDPWTKMNGSLCVSIQPMRMNFFTQFPI